MSSKFKTFPPSVVLSKNELDSLIPNGLPLAGTAKIIQTNKQTVTKNYQTKTIKTTTTYENGEEIIQTEETQDQKTTQAKNFNQHSNDINFLKDGNCQISESYDNVSYKGPERHLNNNSKMESLSPETNNPNLGVSPVFVEQPAGYDSPVVFESVNDPAKTSSPSANYGAKLAANGFATGFATNSSTSGSIAKKLPPLSPKNSPQISKKISPKLAPKITRKTVSSTGSLSSSNNFNLINNPPKLTRGNSFNTSDEVIKVDRKVRSLSNSSKNSRRSDSSRDKYGRLPNRKHLYNDPNNLDFNYYNQSWGGRNEGNTQRLGSFENHFQTF